MDGFYVCKIKKLSDKKPGETNADDAETNKEIANASGEEVGTKVENIKSPITPRSNNKKGKKRGIQEEDPKPKKNPKKISAPPPRGKTTKKKRLGAKMLKPRRIKPEKMV